MAVVEECPLCCESINGHRKSNIAVYYTRCNAVACFAYMKKYIKERGPRKCPFCNLDFVNLKEEWAMTKLRGKIHREAWENAVQSNVVWEGFEDTRWAEFDPWSNEPGWGTWNSYPLLDIKTAILWALKLAQWVYINIDVFGFAIALPVQTLVLKTRLLRSFRVFWRRLPLRRLTLRLSKHRTASRPFTGKAVPCDRWRHI